MKKFYLNNLDCAQCANRIETELRKHKSLEFATINFATKMMAIDADSEELARSIVGSVEPLVEILASGEGREQEQSSSIPWPAAGIITSAVLLVVGVVFNGQLHETRGAIAEYAILIPAYLLVAWPVLESALSDLVRGRIFNEMFLMAVATIGAIIIHQLPEAVGVMLFYSIGEYLQERAVDRSRRSISQLMSLRPEFARIIADGKSRIVDPEEVSVGDFVEIMPGERIPVDGEIVEGSSFADTSSLTGESVPRSVGKGDSVNSGYVNESGRLVVRTTAPFGKSAAARILDLVENAATHKAPTEKFMNRLASVYTPFVVISAVLLAVIPPLLVPGALFRDWAYRALVLLVISCPCALVISIPLGYFGGIGSASRHKILVKGSNYLDALLKVDTVVFDKTGTLTKGNFEVVDVQAESGFSRGDILRLAAAAESLSPHPIAGAIRRAAGGRAAGPGDDRGEAGPPAAAGAAAAVHVSTEVKGKGVMAVVDGRVIRAGNDRLMEEAGIVPGHGSEAGTIVHVAIDGTYAGRILVADAIKEEAAETVRELKARGVRRVVMLTGDRDAVAGDVAAKVGIDEYYAGLLPQDKVARLEELKASTVHKGNVVFVGDGMNDAPVLMSADVGIAMGGLGSDAAIEAADIVIMDDSIARVPLAMEVASFTRKIVMQNVLFSLGVKSVFLVLGAAGEANMWEAVIADVGVAILAVLNAIRAARFDIGIRIRSLRATTTSL